MRLNLSLVSTRRQRLKSAAAQALVDDYLRRAGAYLPVQLSAYACETDLLASLEKTAGRTAAFLVAFDSRGQAFTSEDLAGELQRLRDAGQQQVCLAVGPADGWSREALARADRLISLGAMTLPHELALVIVAEQVYRALTISAGHPYHGGHA